MKQQSPILNLKETASNNGLEKAPQQDLIRRIKDLQKENQQLRFANENREMLDILNPPALTNKELIEQLIENQELLKSTLSSIDDDVYVFNKDHKLISSHVHPAKSVLIDNPEDHLGVAYHKLFDAAIAAKLDVALKNVIHTQITQQFEYCIPDPCYSLYFKANINYRKDSSDNYAGFTMVVREITEEKIADKKITASEKKYRSVVESVREIIFQTNIQGQITYINPAWKEISAFDIYESMDQPIFDFVHSADKDTVQKLFQEMVSNKRDEVKLESRFTNKFGKIFWVDMFFKANLDDNGSIADISGTLSDITQRKEAEEILKQKNQELSKTNQELDRFVYSASHDLRAPLASTLGLINISRITEDTKERTYYLELMEQSLNRMDKLIQDLTDYSRNARLAIETEEIHFEHMIKDIFQRLKYLKNIDTVAISTKISLETGFYSDKIRLYIILINLISNAIKYHKYDQPKPYIKINITANAHQVVMSVTDNGIGIDKNYVDKIFTMFFQVSRDAVGSGLGLYIAMETVNKLHGNIKVSSVINEGSCFTVTIPNAASYQYETQD